MKQILGIALLASMTVLAGSARAEEDAPLSIPLDSSLPTFVMVVEPVRVVPITEYRFHDQLCGKEWQVVKRNGQYTTERPAWGRMNCGGQYRTVPAPSSPTGSAYYYVGEQSFPHLNKQTLAAQFTSALSGIANVRIADADSIRRQRNGSLSVPLGENEQGPFLVRAVVSELSRSGDTGETGSGITPLTVLLGGITRKEVNAFLRLEVQLISGSNGQVVASFPAIGTSTTSKIAFTLFTGGFAFDDWDKTHGITAGASREAVEQASRQIFIELKNFSSQSMES